MTTLPLSTQIPDLTHFTSLTLPVLKLFLIPIGGGIPAGVMLARANDLAWPITTGLYLKPAVRVPPDAFLFVQTATKRKQKMPVTCGGHLFRGLFM